MNVNPLKLPMGTLCTETAKLLRTTVADWLTSTGSSPVTNWSEYSNLWEEQEEEEEEEEEEEKEEEEEEEKEENEEK